MQHWFNYCVLLEKYYKKQLELNITLYDNLRNHYAY